MSALPSAERYDAAIALLQMESMLPPEAAIIPLRPREKRPLKEGWTSVTAGMRRSPEFRNLFRGEVGIGLLCGPPSDGLYLVDVDAEWLVLPTEKAVSLLAIAPRIRGGRGAKWIVRVPAERRGFALKDRRGYRVGEFLGCGQQGVIAGIHPVKGTAYAWDRVGQIPLVNSEEFLEVFSQLEVSSHD
jgi:hypothetical protein